MGDVCGVPAALGVQVDTSVMGHCLQPWALVPENWAAQKGPEP